MTSPNGTPQGDLALAFVVLLIFWLTILWVIGPKNPPRADD